jgi:hypothetical protein
MARSRRRFVAALALALSMAGADAGIAERRSDSGNDIPVADSCPLDDEAGGIGVPIVPLDPAALDSLARALAVPNQVHLARIDSVWRAGGFGKPSSDAARSRAHLLASLTTTNCYRYLLQFAADSTRIVEACESTLIDTFQRYSDPSLFSIAKLQRLRLGRGRVCLRYELGE